MLSFHGVVVVVVVVVVVCSSGSTLSFFFGGLALGSGSAAVPCLVVDAGVMVVASAGSRLVCQGLFATGSGCLHGRRGSRQYRH